MDETSNAFLPPSAPTAYVERKTNTNTDLENSVAKITTKQKEIDDYLLAQKNKDKLNEILDKRHDARYPNKKGGTKRNKKSFSRLAKKRNTKRRKSRRLR
jgi:hypothetical protein